MMTPERLSAEQSVLNYYLPRSAYRFCDMSTSKPYLKIAALTNSKNVYTLRIELDNFPAEVPKVFVNKMLYDKTGHPMSEASGSMHTLGSENDRTRICHYGSNSWAPSVSLFKVYMKCRLWLEMYETHLRTGKPIDYYLKHQA